MSVDQVAVIRREPTAADLNALAAVATRTVLDIANMDGALGHDAIALLYVQRIYAAVVEREVKPKKARKTG
jgi:hypothetical protein